MATQTGRKSFAKAAKAETRRALNSKRVRVAVKKALDGGVRKTAVERLLRLQQRKKLENRQGGLSEVSRKEVHC